MTAHRTITPVLIEALDTVADFIRKVAGLDPTPAEIADALTRYFVMNEIKDHILMNREGVLERPPSNVQP